MKCVRAQLEDAAELTWWRGRPEAELLHERGVLVGDKRLKLSIEGCEFWMVLDGV